MGWHHTCGMVVRAVPVEEYSSGTGLPSQDLPAQQRSAVWSNTHFAAREWNPHAKELTCSAIVWQRACSSKVHRWMKSASYSAIAVLIPRRFMRRLIFQHCDLWHFPGREVPDESPATSGWRLSRPATQPRFQADISRALPARIHLLC